jgi:hypothetical protein
MDVDPQVSFRRLATDRVTHLWRMDREDRVRLYALIMIKSILKGTIALTA